MPQTLSEIKSLLAAHGLRPRHRFGQNFLHDANHMTGIITAAGIEPGDAVLEVGPGTGALSEWLLEAGAVVVAVEIDRGLEPILRERVLARYPERFTLLIADVLAGKHEINPEVLAALEPSPIGRGQGEGTFGREDVSVSDHPSNSKIPSPQPSPRGRGGKTTHPEVLTALEPSPFGRGQGEGTFGREDVSRADPPSNSKIPSPQPSPRGRGGKKSFKLVANLPYNVASPLLANLVLDHPEMMLAVVMLQREVADRLTAPPGGKEYGPLGVLMQAMCRVDRVATLSPSCFWPQPKVGSAVVRLRRRDVPLTDDPHALSRTLQLLFGKRRKQIGSILGRHRVLPDGIAASARPEQLTVEQIITLSRALG